MDTIEKPKIDYGMILVILLYILSLISLIAVT